VLDLRLQKAESATRVWPTLDTVLKLVAERCGPVRVHKRPHPKQLTASIVLLCLFSCHPEHSWYEQKHSLL